MVMRIQTIVLLELPVLLSLGAADELCNLQKVLLQGRHTRLLLHALWQWCGKWWVVVGDRMGEWLLRVVGNDWL